MKKCLFLFVLVSVFLASKCEKETTVELGQPFQLKIGETVKLNADNLSVSFVQVKEDSRCPKNTNCIWEGQAIIELSIKGKATKNIALIMSAGKSAKLAEKVDAYTYTLKKVDPYPESGTKIGAEDYVVELEVSKN